MVFLGFALAGLHDKLKSEKLKSITELIPYFEEQYKSIKGTDRQLELYYADKIKYYRREYKSITGTEFSQSESED